MARSTRLVMLIKNCSHLRMGVYKYILICVYMLLQLTEEMGYVYIFFITALS